MIQNIKYMLKCNARKIMINLHLIKRIFYVITTGCYFNNTSCLQLFLYFIVLTYDYCSSELNELLI